MEFFRVTDPSSMLSPSLVVDRGVVRTNLDAMIAMAGGPQRLRPHVKTHKMPAIIRMCEEKGITKQKVATVAEAEMTAEAGCRDIFLAYPIIGPNIARIAKLAHHFPDTTFRVLMDDPQSTEVLDVGMKRLGIRLHVLLDLEVGMGRTGIAPGDAAFALYQQVASSKNLIADGLHAYDGHLQIFDLAERRERARPGIEKTLALRDRLIASGYEVPRLILGGTPTFPVHASLDEPNVELSPGTCTLYDMSYAAKFPDLPFTPAAAVLTRVISRPRPGRLCLDVGHKAVAADPAGPRLTLPDLPGATLGGQSEEHLVVDTPDAEKYPPGTVFLAFPTHVCPTSALHRKAYVVENGVLVDEWEVAARDRVLRF